MTLLFINFSCLFLFCFSFSSQQLSEGKSNYISAEHCFDSKFDCYRTIDLHHQEKQALLVQR